MAEIQQITNYDTDTINKFLAQYKDSENLKTIIKASNRSAEDIEKALFEIRDEYWIDTSVGVQLDVIGAIWDVSRLGDNDTDYRTRIIQKFSLNNSGEPELIIATLKLMFGATYVDYKPFYPAGYDITTDASITVEELNILSPSGVQALLLETALQDQTGADIDDQTGNPIQHVKL